MFSTEDTPKLVTKDDNQPLSKKSADYKKIPSLVSEGEIFIRSESVGKSVSKREKLSISNSVDQSVNESKSKTGSDATNSNKI